MVQLLRALVSLAGDLCVVSTHTITQNHSQLQSEKSQCPLMTSYINVRGQSTHKHKINYSEMLNH